MWKKWGGHIGEYEKAGKRGGGGLEQLNPISILQGKF